MNTATGRVTRILDPVKRAIAKLACENAAECVNDGDCTEGLICDNGVCVDAEPTDGTPCDLGPCTTGETYLNGMCQGGSPVDCPDGLCAVYSCDESGAEGNCDNVVMPPSDPACGTASNYCSAIGTCL
jgi:hypothetical protein